MSAFFEVHSPGNTVLLTPRSKENARLRRTLHCKCKYFRRFFLTDGAGETITAII